MSNNQNEKKDFIVLSQKLAGKLMIAGFVLLKLKPSKKGYNRNVFIFRESDELLSFIRDNS